MLNLMVSFATKTTRTRMIGGVFAILAVAGCESGARQDPFSRPNSLEAVQMPAISSQHMYHASTKTETSSPVAYEQPPTFSLSDRPILENMSTSLELADYRQGLKQAGLLSLLGRNGPFTVFAIPNEPFERYAKQVPGGLMNAPNAPILSQVLKYTIVRGNWSPAKIARSMKHLKTDRLALRTLGGDILTVQRDAADGQFVLVNASGRIARIWLNGAPQSNGALYITQDILPPRD